MKSLLASPLWPALVWFVQSQMGAETRRRHSLDWGNLSRGTERAKASYEAVTRSRMIRDTVSVWRISWRGCSQCLPWTGSWTKWVTPWCAQSGRARVRLWVWCWGGEQQHRDQCGEGGETCDGQQGVAHQAHGHDHSQVHSVSHTGRHAYTW